MRWLSHEVWARRKPWKSLSLPVLCLSTENLSSLKFHHWWFVSLGWELPPLWHSPSHGCWASLALERLCPTDSLCLFSRSCQICSLLSLPFKVPTINFIIQGSPHPLPLDCLRRRPHSPQTPTSLQNLFYLGCLLPISKMGTNKNNKQRKWQRNAEVFQRYHPGL